MSEFGRIPLTLITALHKLYPPRCRFLNESERSHDRYAGKVELVELLTQHFNQQQPEAVLEEKAAHTDPETGVRTYNEIYGGLRDEDDD